MTTSLTIDRTHEVPVQVFEKYLDALETAGVSSEMIQRLRKTLLEDKAYTERALKTAILGEESLT
jgi:hypothetical protein